MRSLLLRGGRSAESAEPLADVVIEGGRIVSRASSPVAELDLAGATLLPAFVNAQDVLDTAVLPPLGSKDRYASLYEWLSEVEGELSGAGAGSGMALPLVDRLFLGGMRNLLSGVASVIHHHPDHRSLARPDFPVRVQRRFGFAHSPRRTPALRRTYRSSDRRVPWLVRAAEGADPALRHELELLAAANVLRQNTVIVHGTALEPEDGVRIAAAKACLVWCPESDLRLFGRTPSIAALRSFGARVGLGSDGAPEGARDFLSNLAVAGRESGFSASELLALATSESAEVARMPLGGVSVVAVSVKKATRALGPLLAGERGAVSLLIVRGRALYGEPALLAAAGEPAVTLRVDGATRAIATRLGRRLASLVRGRRQEAQWLRGVAI